MTPLGIHWPLLLTQLANLALIAAWLGLSALALRLVRRSALPPSARAIWVALIILLPLVGALACLIARPRASASTHR